MTEPMGDDGQEGGKRIEFDEESDEDNDSQAKASEKPKVAASSDDKNAKYLANMILSLQGQLKKAVTTSLKTAETDLQKYKTAEQERAAQEVEGPKQAPDSIRKITGKRKVATPGPPTYETPKGKKNKTSIGNTRGSGTEEDDSEEDEEEEEKADSEWETWIRGLIRQIVASALGSNKSFGDAMSLVREEIWQYDNLVEPAQLGKFSAMATAIIKRVGKEVADSRQMNDLYRLICETEQYGEASVGVLMVRGDMMALQRAMIEQTIVGGMHGITEDWTQPGYDI